MKTRVGGGLLEKMRPREMKSLLVGVVRKGKNLGKAKATQRRWICSLVNYSYLAPEWSLLQHHRECIRLWGSRWNMLFTLCKLFTLISCTQCWLRAVFCIHLFLTACKLSTIAAPILQIKNWGTKQLVSQLATARPGI